MLSLPCVRVFVCDETLEWGRVSRYFKRDWIFHQHLSPSTFYIPLFPPRDPTVRKQVREILISLFFWTEHIGGVVVHIHTQSLFRALIKQLLLFLDHFKYKNIQTSGRLFPNELKTNILVTLSRRSSPDCWSWAWCPLGQSSSFISWFISRRRLKGPSENPSGVSFRSVDKTSWWSARGPFTVGCTVQCKCVYSSLTRHENTWSFMEPPLFLSEDIKTALSASRCHLQWSTKTETSSEGRMRWDRWHCERTVWKKEKATHSFRHLL